MHHESSVGSFACQLVSIANLQQTSTSPLQQVIQDKMHDQKQHILLVAYLNLPAVQACVLIHHNDK